MLCRCFFRVTRPEAEEMLEANPKNSLIMPPSSVANSPVTQTADGQVSTSDTHMAICIYTH